MIELKPCPFCGNEAELCGGEDVCNGPYWYVACGECGASVYGDDDKQAAIDRWNRRAKDA